MDACGTTDGCVAVSYVNPSCYLKSTLNLSKSRCLAEDRTQADISSSDNVIGAYVTPRDAPASSSVLVSSSVPASTSVSASSSVAASSPIAASSSAPAPVSTACPASYTCPENNGCTIQGANSRTFILACDTDVYGGDFASMETQSLEACNQACLDNTQCVATAFVGGNGAGTCYLKGENNGASTNTNVDGMFSMVLLS
jgi:hypothetical protein